MIRRKKTHIPAVVDPWAGSYLMEKLTQQMADAAWTLIEEVDAMGGMTKAVESGWAKLKIEASAAEKQARIDRGEDVIVGVNKYRLGAEAPIQTREVDNTVVREAQLKRLREVRREARCASGRRRAGAITALRHRHRDLLDLAIRAVLARATGRGGEHGNGEGLGRYRAKHAARLRLYGAAVRERRRMERNAARDRALRERRGPPSAHSRRQARKDGHDRGAKVARLRLRTWDSMSTSARSSRPRRNARARRSRTTCTPSGSRRSPPVTRRSCPR